MTTSEIAKCFRNLENGVKDRKIPTAITIATGRKYETAKVSDSSDKRGIRSPMKAKMLSVQKYPLTLDEYAIGKTPAAPATIPKRKRSPEKWVFSAYEKRYPQTITGNMANTIESRISSMTIFFYRGKSRTPRNGSVRLRTALDRRMSLQRECWLQ